MILASSSNLSARLQKLTQMNKTLMLVMAVIEENNENQNDQIDIRSKLVKEFEEKLASHGFKLNSTLDLVSSEIDPSIETEIVTKACDKIEQPSNESEIRIVEQYHPPSNFKFPSKKIGKWNRSCKHDYFERWKWLHYTGYLIAKCMLNSYLTPNRSQKKSPVTPSILIPEEKFEFP